MLTTMKTGAPFDVVNQGPELSEISEGVCVCEKSVCQDVSEDGWTSPPPFMLWLARCRSSTGLVDYLPLFCVSLLSELAA